MIKGFISASFFFLCFPSHSYNDERRKWRLARMAGLCNQSHAAQVYFFLKALATRKPNSFFLIACISTNVISFSDCFQRNLYVPTLLIAQWAL